VRERQAGSLIRAAMRLHAARASSASAVSKVCIFSPAAGTLCARVPTGIVTEPALASRS
jgi:hypothetical protein